MAPILLAVLVRAHTRYRLIGCHLAVGAVFAGINLSPTLAHGWESLTAVVGVPWRVWCDPTDLIALGMLAVSWVAFVPTMRRATRFSLEPWRRAIQGTGVVAAAVACAATSPIPPPKPAVSDGQIVTQRWYGDAPFLLEARTGRVLARLNIKGGLSEPVLSEGVLFYRDDRYVVALDPKSGSIRWRAAFGDAFTARNLLVDTQRVYLVWGNRKGTNLAALDRRNGGQIWTAPIALEYGYQTSKQTYLAGDLLLVPLGKRLSAYDCATGQRRWAYRAEAELRWPVADADRAYVGDDQGTLHALELRTGRSLWQLSTGSDDSFNGYIEMAPLSAADGTVLIGIDEHLVAIDGRSRKERWRVEAYHGVTYHKVAVAFGDDVRGLDLVTGQPRWTLPFDEHMLLTPAIGDGVLVLRPHGSQLTAIDVVTGSELWVFDLDEGSKVVTTAGSGVLVVGARH